MGQSGRLEHMAMYQAADLILDVFPHSGGATAIEEVASSVPLLTLRGNNIAGRLSASLLTAIGYPELIADTIEQYVDFAVTLSDNREFLKHKRARLQNELMESPVIKGYCGAVERAYREFWRTYCAT
jgi:predicted O-linked N-acetylglucosamine transferase (SPINDLY family)